MSGNGKKTSLTESLGALVASQVAQVAKIPETRPLRKLHEQAAAARPLGQQGGPGPVRSWEEYELNWDDNEERRYRDWLRETQQTQEADVEWSELDGEVAYREKLRREAEDRAGQEIEWDDSKEKEFRRKYIELRKQQLLEAEWDEYRAEEDYRQRMHAATQANKGKPVVWDDMDERKCQERYRKKYSK